jgi:hypothetical protein
VGEALPVLWMDRHGLIVILMRHEVGRWGDTGWKRREESSYSHGSRKGRQATHEQRG